MSYTITGTVHSVEAEQSREYNGKTFKSRDVILSCPETINGNTYPNFPKLSAKLDKVLPHVANLQQGQTVTLHFNIKGFNGQKGNFTGLEIWKVEAAQTQQAAPQQAQAQPIQAQSAPVEQFPDSQLPF
jgi:hypothetical protein